MVLVQCFANQFEESQRGTTTKAYSPSQQAGLLLVLSVLLRITAPFPAEERLPKHQLDEALMMDSLQPSSLYQLHWGQPMQITFEVDEMCGLLGGLFLVIYHDME